MAKIAIYHHAAQWVSVSLRNELELTIQPSYISIRYMSRTKSTQYVILGMLSIEPKSGYDIKKTVEFSLRLFWRESYGQIYPALKQLSRDGLITEGQGTDSGRADRRIYEITDHGRALLREWLSKPHQDQPPRNEFLLRLFFGRAAGPGVALRQIKDFKKGQKEMLIKLAGFQKQANAQQADYFDLPFWMLTMEYGIAQTRAGIAWSERAEKTLEALASKPSQLRREVPPRTIGAKRNKPAAAPHGMKGPR